MIARHQAIAEIASHRVAKTQDYLQDAGADIYGQYVFNEGAQRQYLAKPIFQKLRRTIEGHEPFDPAIVDAVGRALQLTDVERTHLHLLAGLNPPPTSPAAAPTVGGGTRSTTHQASRRYSSCARTDHSAAGHSERSTSAYTTSTTSRAVGAPPNAATAART